MSAGIYHIDIEQGGDFALAVTYKDSAGTVFNLASGYTARMDIKESYLDTTALDSLTTSSGEITLTSGIGTTYPPGYLVGEVYRIDKPPNEAFLSITLDE